METKIGKYAELTKPKVTLLNLLVGVTCFILAAYPTIDWLKLAAFSIVGYLAAGGCGVLNRRLRPRSRQVNDAHFKKSHPRRLHNNNQSPNIRHSDNCSKLCLLILLL